MRAAVVTTFDSAPRYQQFPTPVPAGDDEMLVDVLAAGLHQRVRSQADGSHYTSTDELPLVPGIDGVGRGPDGSLRYFVLPDTSVGSMAEQTVINLRQSVELPYTIDPVVVAAAMNPAMSSWVALRQRVQFQAGQDVLILGATGNAGQMAVQIAKRLGAGHVIAAGRDPERLAILTEIGADTIVSLAGGRAGFDTGRSLGEVAGDVDVVIDYLWGPATEHNMPAVLTHRTDKSQPLTWIEIGSMSGPQIALPSAWLRATRLQIVGSGQGSVSTREIIGELPALAAEITTGTYAIDAVSTPLSQVQTTWNAPIAPGQRIVFVP